MRSFVVSLIIMCAIITSITLNARYCESTTQELLDALDSIDKNDSASIEEFSILWNERIFYYDMTMNKKLLDSVNVGISHMRASIISNDDAMMEKGIELCKQALKDIDAFSRFSIKNIL